MSLRREFSVALRIAIVNRASDQSYNIHCESCGIFCKSRRDYEVDHVIPEEMRPPVDKLEKLKAADGQLLCLQCHAGKTKKDQGEIGLARRQEAYAKGVERPGKKRLRRPPRPTKPRRPSAAGQSQIARRFGL